MRRSVFCLGGGLLILTGAPLLFAAGEPPLEAVVGVRALRGFQGLFEWVQGAGAVDPQACLGGRLESSGVLLDLHRIAADLEVELSPSFSKGDAFVLTTLRSVHNPRAVFVHLSLPSEGPLPLVLEVPAEVAAQDPAVNLALLRFPGGHGAPHLSPGVRLGKGGPTRPGQEILRAHFQDGQVRVLRDLVSHIGEVGPGDPFWLPALAAPQFQMDVSPEQSGGPLFLPGSEGVGGLAADGQRIVWDKTEALTAGVDYMITVGVIETFLSRVLTGASPTHAALPHPAPALATVGQDLAALLGRSGPGGYLVMADYPSKSEPLLREGDLLLKGGGKGLGAGGYSLDLVAFESSAGEPLRVEGLREGKPITVNLPLRLYTGYSAREVKAIEFAGGWLQDPAPLFQEWPSDVAGAVVAHVVEGSPAHAAGLEFRDLVQGVFGMGRTWDITSVSDLERALKELLSLPEFDGQVGLRTIDWKSPNRYAGLRVIRLGETRP